MWKVSLVKRNWTLMLLFKSFPSICRIKKIFIISNRIFIPQRRLIEDHCWYYDGLNVANKHPSTKDNPLSSNKNCHCFLKQWTNKRHSRFSEMEDFECTIWRRENCCSLRDCKKSAKGINIFILFHLTIVHV